MGRRRPLRADLVRLLACAAWPHRDGSALTRLAHNAAAENAVGFAVLIAPVTLVLAWVEHRWGCTPGKAAMGVHVVGAQGGGLPSMRQCLVRNAFKVALPWLVAHAAVFALVDSGRASPPRWAVPVVLLSYVLPGVYMTALFTRTGRTPYDVISGTAVRA